MGVAATLPELSEWTLPGLILSITLYHDKTLLKDFFKHKKLTLGPRKAYLL